MYERIIGTVCAGLLAVGAAAVPASAATAAPAAEQIREPGAPGCTLDGMTANHLTGAVVWHVSCDEPRWVTVDSTSFAGTPDDHVIVDEQKAVRFVDAGESWTGAQLFDTVGIDQIRSQAVTFVTEGDASELPAIIGGATG